MTDDTTQALPSEATFSGLPQITPRAADHGNLRSDLASVINRYSRENGSNTPDFILAQYLANCLDAFDTAIWNRAMWYGRVDSIGGPVAMPKVAEND
jgi:hypothetical protein